jgi:hypothetical protein
MTNRVLLAEIRGGSLRKIVIPDDWCITFGPVAVGVARQPNQESPNVLRIYADKKRDNLMAVYRDIVSVSDERIEITERKVHKKQKIFSKKGGNGQQSYAAEIRKTVWSNPFADEPEADEQDFDEDILTLPMSMQDEDLPK